MMGIRFEIPNEYGQFLKKILENLKIENGFWKIVTDDIIKKMVTTYLMKKFTIIQTFKK